MTNKEGPKKLWVLKIILLSNVGMPPPQQQQQRVVVLG